jgi:TPR repeat protein
MQAVRKIIPLLFLIFSFSKVYGAASGCECEDLITPFAAGKENYSEKMLLAQCYLSGHEHYKGCERRPEKAAELMEKIYKEAPKPDPIVGYTLARLYFLGNGVKEDFTRYRAIIKKLAEEKYRPAMTEYGMALFDGIGGVKNVEEAKIWTSQAATLGDERAVQFMKKFEVKK